MLAGFCLVVLVRRSERLAEERSRFAAAAAHELRTPLAGIRLHGEMLALSLGNPKRVNEYAARITDEAERLTRVVSNVFSYTQVDQKLPRMHTERGDLALAVQEALTLVQPIVERLGAEVVLRTERDLPLVSFEQDAIHQIVRNLVDNAEKYSRGCRDRRIQVSVTADPDAALLTVRDHGPGIGRADRGRIFKPFSRHSAQPGDQRSGTRVSGGPRPRHRSRRRRRVQRCRRRRRLLHRAIPLRQGRHRDQHRGRHRDRSTTGRVSDTAIDTP